MKYLLTILILFACLTASAQTTFKPGPVTKGVRYKWGTEVWEALSSFTAGAAPYTHKTRWKKVTAEVLNSAFTLEGLAKELELLRKEIKLNNANTDSLKHRVKLLEAAKKSTPAQWVRITIDSTKNKGSFGPLNGADSVKLNLRWY